MSGMEWGGWFFSVYPDTRNKPSTADMGRSQAQSKQKEVLQITRGWEGEHRVPWVPRAYMGSRVGGTGSQKRHVLRVAQYIATMSVLGRLLTADAGRRESLEGTYVSFLCSFSCCQRQDPEWGRPLLWPDTAFSMLLLGTSSFLNSNPIRLLPTLDSQLSHPSAISCLSDCH